MILAWQHGRPHLQSLSCARQLKEHLGKFSFLRTTYVYLFDQEDVEAYNLTLIYTKCSYLAPEYFQHGKVSDKTDVYAFGVVLLELLTGRKPIETGRGSGEENLVLWVGTLLLLFIYTSIYFSTIFRLTTKIIFMNVTYSDQYFRSCLCISHQRMCIIF